MGWGRSTFARADQVRRVFDAFHADSNGLPGAALQSFPRIAFTRVLTGRTVNGLPESMINITLDGVSNNDNFLKSTDGFFASVTPRQDAVEAVTVTLAAAEANMGGSGAVTINFTTRSGTNRFSGGLGLHNARAATAEQVGHLLAATLRHRFGRCLRR